MLHRRVEIEKQYFRKKSALFQGKVALLPNLTLPPANLHSKIIMQVNDYRLKYVKIKEQAYPSRK
jgi:hypothetical protein